MHAACPVWTVGGAVNCAFSQSQRPWLRPTRTPDVRTLPVPYRFREAATLSEGTRPMLHLSVHRALGGPKRPTRPAWGFSQCGYRAPPLLDSRIISNSYNSARAKFVSIKLCVINSITMSVDLRSPGRITIFSLGRLSSPHHFYGPPAGLLDGRPLSSASPSCAGCAVRRSQHKEEQLRLLIHHAQRAECIAEAARHRCTCVSCLLDIACYSWCRMRRIAI